MPSFRRREGGPRFAGASRRCTKRAMFERVAINRRRHHGAAGHRRCSFAKAAYFR